MPRDRRRRLDNHQHTQRCDGPCRDAVSDAKRNLCFRGTIERHTHPAHLPRLVGGVATPSQRDGARCPVQQPLADRAQQHVPERPVV
jgi:hypothetical protein